MTDFAPLIMTQLADPFRMGLMAALMFTTWRNAAVTGVALPFCAGVVFVAVIIAISFPPAKQPLWMVVATGVMANLILGAIMFALWRMLTALQK